MTQEEVKYENNVLDEITKPITTLTVIASCTSIRGESEGNYAFINTCNTLESCYFEVGSQLEVIQLYSFYKCIKLKEIDLSVCTRLKSIGTSAFQGCKSLNKVTFPSSLQSISANAFYSANLINVFIPASVLTIGSYSFAYNTQLTSFEFETDSSVNSIWDHFLISAKIQSFYIPAKIKTLTGNSFESCTTLTELKINESNIYLKVVDNVLFNKDMTILYICPPGKKGNYSIPDSVTVLETTSFLHSQLEYIEFPPNITRIISWAFAYAKIRELNLPSSIRTIEYDAFRGCNNLKSIIFPEGLESIETSAFSNCASLTIVQFPSTLKELGGGVFTGVENVNITFDPKSNLEYESELNWIITKDKTFISQCLGSENNYTIDYTYETI